MRTYAAMAGALVVALSLVGCTVDVVDGDADGPSGTSSSAESSADGAGDGGSGDGQSEPGVEIDLSRDDLIAAATRTMRCDDELTLLDNAMSTRVEGACDVLVLNTTGSYIVADDVATVKVIGDDNVVFVGAVETLLVNGEGNVVLWSGETPTVTDVGSTNVLKAE